MKIGKGRKSVATRALEQPPKFTERPDQFLEAFLTVKGIPRAEISEILSFFASDSEAKLNKARAFIENSVIDASSEPGWRVAFAYQTSEQLLPGYATLDTNHRLEIQQLLANIRAYLGDTSRSRPLNFLMLAAPGSGKSHFIKQLAKKMKSDRVEAVTFNMASMQTYDEMARPLDDLRNLKINDRLPLLFLDEFDTNKSNYAALLPLLWDGEFQSGPRDLKIGKSVIVLAGSSPDLPKIMKASGKMRIDETPSSRHGKLIDLLSRINGGTIEIPSLEVQNDGRDRRVDKVCLAISLAKARFGDRLSEMPRVLLRFIAHTRFQFGVRSIAHLIDSISSKAFDGEKLASTKLGLPFSNRNELLGSSLKLHLSDQNQAVGIVRRWNDFARDDCNIPILNSILDNMRFNPISGEPISYA